MGNIYEHDVEPATDAECEKLDSEWIDESEVEENDEEAEG